MDKPATTGIKPDTQERQKRQPVLTLARNYVLIQIAAMPPIRGLPRQDRNQTELLAQRAVEAINRGLNASAYGEELTSTGLKIFDRVEKVRITHLLEQLASLGSGNDTPVVAGTHDPHRHRSLRYEFGYWFSLDKGGVVNTLVFGEAGTDDIPEEVTAALILRFNHCTVWANLRYRQEGEGQVRLDCINLAKGLPSVEPAQELIIPVDHRGTYRII